MSASDPLAARTRDPLPAGGGPGNGDPSLDGKAAVLLSTCQGYHFILDAFLLLWRRYWPGCPLPLYVSSEGDLGRFVDAFGIVALERERDDGFLESWVEALRRIPEPIVLVVQEDFLLERPADDTMLRGLVRAMQGDESILGIRTMPWPGPLGPRRIVGTIELGEIGPAERWSFSWQAALWRREVLEAFLVSRIERGNARVARHLREHPGLSAGDWQHRVPRPPPDAYAWFNPEWHGHELAEMFPGGVVLGVLPRSPREPEAMLTAPLPYRPTAIEGGELKYHARRLLRREGIAIRAPRLESALTAAARHLYYRGYAALRAARDAVVPRRSP